MVATGSTNGGMKLVHSSAGLSLQTLKACLTLLVFHSYDTTSGMYTSGLLIVVCTGSKPRGGGSWGVEVTCGWTPAFYLRLEDPGQPACSWQHTHGAARSLSWVPRYANQHTC